MKTKDNEIDFENGVTFNLLLPNQNNDAGLTVVGKIQFNSVADLIRYKAASSVKTLVSEDDVQTLLNKTLDEVVIGSEAINPTGTAGKVIYNSTEQRFKIYENGRWKNLIPQYNDAFYVQVIPPLVANTWTIVTIETALGVPAPPYSEVQLLMNATSARNMGAREFGSTVNKVISTDADNQTITVVLDANSQCKVFTQTITGTYNFTILGFKI